MDFPKLFIKATEEYNTFEKAVAAPYFRKKFTVTNKTEADILITACGFYDLYINGKKITKGYFAPYISNPDDYVYYDKYTVALNKGENVIGVHLGNGFQNNPGGHIWEFDISPFRSAPTFALSCEFTEADGTKTVIESGTDFKTAPSPIVYDDYRFGECYDANKEIDGWNIADFDDSDWSNAITAVLPKGEARLVEADPITVQGKIKPVEIIPVKDGYIYDFGMNFSGICRLNIKGNKGQKVELRYAEQIIDGDIDLPSVWFVREHWERDKKIVHNDVYICKGEGEETYTSFFTYHGFRYVKVTGITEEQATKDLLTYITLHSDLKTCGGFSTSHQTANTLQQLTIRSDLSNFHYFPTDCPHREKNGWTIDAAISAEQFYLNLTVGDSLHEWMHNIVKSQKEDGLMTGIVPTGGWGYDWGNGPCSDRVIVYLPYYAYMYRGDKQMIIDCADAIERYLKYIQNKTMDNGLIAIGLGDWCHVGRPQDVPKAPLEVVDTALCLNIAEMAAFLFDVIGMSDRKEFALSLAYGYRKAAREQLINFDNCLVNGNCQGAQSIAIAYGFFNDDEKPMAVKRLVELIEQAGNHFDAGVFGNRVIYEVLSDYGYTDLAFYMITRPEFPSYGNWIERGATTLWEKMMEEENDYSKNHHFWGCVSAWFIKYLAGIRYNPTAKNLKEVIIKPNFVKALNDATAYYESNYGKIESKWKREDNSIIIKVTVPDCMEGSIVLPDGYIFDDGETVKSLCSGNYTVKTKIN